MSSPPSPSTDKPPYYILVSHSGQQPAAGALDTSLSHPIIQYHYADDSPLALLPRSTDERVLVLDYDLSGYSTPRARSIAGKSTVTGVRITDAPGAGTGQEDQSKSRKVFVLETTVFEEKIATDKLDPQQVLAEFKQRNATLRQVLNYDSEGHEPRVRLTPVPASLSPRIA